MIKDIAELVKAGVISQETANDIQKYYDQKGSAAPNRLFIVFGVLGAILVGLGIILILAHNWDELPRWTKTIFAFVPLIVGQILSGFTLLKKAGSVAWRESSAVLLFFGIGASIALVAQIYNLSGDLSSFLLTWMLLALPVVYLLKSSATSLMYIIGITYYVTVNYMKSGPEELYYLLLLLLILPYYFLLIKRQPYGNFTGFHHWLIPVSLLIVLMSWVHQNGQLMVIAYMSLLGILYLIGQLDYFARQKIRRNGYEVLGSLGTVVMLLGLSFDFFWKELRRWDYHQHEAFSSPEFILAVILTLVAMGLFIHHIRRRPLREIQPVAPVFGLFVLVYFLGMSSSLAIVLVNLLAFGVGVMTIREGAKMNSLGVLNYGLLIIAALVVCRFFDTHLSFVVRGLLFVTVGIGFFMVNYWMLKKRKKDEVQ